MSSRCSCCHPVEWLWRQHRVESLHWMTVRDTAIMTSKSGSNQPHATSLPSYVLCNVLQAGTLRSAYNMPPPQLIFSRTRTELTLSVFSVATAKLLFGINLIIANVRHCSTDFFYIWAPFEELFVPPSLAQRFAVSTSVELNSALQIISLVVLSLLFLTQVKLILWGLSHWLRSITCRAKDDTIQEHDHENKDH